MRDGSRSICSLVSTSAESVALLQKVTNILVKRISFEPCRFRLGVFVAAESTGTRLATARAMTNLCLSAQTVAGSTPPTTRALPCTKPNLGRLQPLKQIPHPELPQPLPQTYSQIPNCHRRQLLTPTLQIYPSTSTKKVLGPLKDQFP